MIVAVDCVTQTAANVVNISFGFDTDGIFGYFARYLDKVSHRIGITFVIAVSDSCTNKMGSPEIAFNVLAVGSFGDNNTTSFSDDIAPCTGVVTKGSYLDPDSPNFDREEPDLVAPGHEITTTIPGGGFATVSGSSFAAPQVAAGVALLFQRAPTVYIPVEQVRAIMMASARHNLEGSSRLSARDGAGGVMLAAADKIVETSDLSDYFSVTGATSNFPILFPFTATAGQRVRVVTAWSHKMPQGETSTRPTTDLDLEVLCGSTLIGMSGSRDNNYEIVEFTAASCPGYQAKISNIRASSGAEYIGVAVSNTDS